jgi:hypothetical protein
MLTESSAVSRIGTPNIRSWPEAAEVTSPPRPSNVDIRADDTSLTGHAGLLLTGELVSRTDLVARLDRDIDAVRLFKRRRRGCSGGELLVVLAEMQAVGGDHLAHLEELREDGAGRAAGGQEGAGADHGRSADAAADRAPVPGGGGGARQDG